MKTGTKTMTAAELKTDFSSVVAELKRGNEVIVTYGRKKEPLATLIPQSKLAKPNYAIQLGDLKKKGWDLRMHDFAMTDEELLGSETAA